MKENDKDMNTIPQHIADKANKMIAKGTKMTFEAICDMFMKSEAKKSKKVFKAAPDMPIATGGNGASNWLAEKNRENAMNNLPSSMRKY